MWGVNNSCSASILISSHLDGSAKTTVLVYETIKSMRWKTKLNVFCKWYSRNGQKSKKKKEKKNTFTFRVIKWAPMLRHELSLSSKLLRKCGDC